MCPDAGTTRELTAEELLTIDRMAREAFEAGHGDPLPSTEIPPAELLEECKTAYLASTLPMDQHPPANPSRMSPGVFGDLATPSPAAVGDLSFDPASNPPSPQTPGIWNPTPMRGGVTAPDFVTQPTPRNDSAIGTAKDVLDEQLVNPAARLPVVSFPEVMQHSVPEHPIIHPDSAIPSHGEVQKEASPMTWAQIVRGYPVNATSAAQKTASPPPGSAARGTRPVGRADSAKSSPTAGAAAGMRKLGSPSKHRSFRRPALVLPQQQAMTHASVPPETMKPISCSAQNTEIASSSGGRESTDASGPLAQAETHLTQVSDLVAWVKNPDTSSLGACQKARQPAEVARVRGGNLQGRGGFPGSLEPVEGTSFTQTHFDPQITTFAAEGGLERLNKTMESVSMQARARGRSASPPGVDLSGPSTGTLNIRTGLDSINEFNQNYGHHVQGAIREARSITGTGTRSGSGSIGASSFGKNTDPDATSTSGAGSDTSTPAGQSTPPRLVLDTELYGRTTTHDNGQNLWQCKTCPQLHPFMADNNAGRALIAKHIKGHLRGERHDPIPRQIVPTAAHHETVMSSLPSSPSVTDGVPTAEEKGAPALPQGLPPLRQGSLFPESGTQFGWPANGEIPIAPLGVLKETQTTAYGVEYNTSVGSQSSIPVYYDPGTGGGPDPQQLALSGQQSHLQGAQSIDHGSQLGPSTAYFRQQSGQLGSHGAHFSHQGTHRNPINLDSPRPSMQPFQPPLANLASEYNRTGYTGVRSPPCSGFGSPSLRDPTFPMNNQFWGQRMNVQSPPGFQFQPPPLLLNSAAPGVSDRGTPPALNLGVGVVGHFHSGGYGAAVSPGPFPYEGYTKPGAFRTPPPQTPRPPRQYYASPGANHPAQQSVGAYGGGFMRVMEPPGYWQPGPPGGSFPLPAVPTGGAFGAPMMPATAAVGQPLTPSAFTTGTPVTPVLNRRGATTY